MRSLRLLRAPFLCGLLWAFCAPGARAQEPGAGVPHPSSVGLDKNTVHDQEYVFGWGWGPGASLLSTAVARSKGIPSPLSLTPSYVEEVYFILSQTEDIEAQIV
jgi:hypothetical protein